MRKRLCGFVAIAAVALAFGPGSARAQVYLGPELVWADDYDVGVGAGLQLDLPSVGPDFGFMADFLIFFPDGPVDYFELNGNLTYGFPLEASTLVPFLLGGLNFARFSGELLGESFSDTDLGLNLGGGLEFDLGTFRPTVSVRAVVGGGDSVFLSAYLPFLLGG